MSDKDIIWGQDKDGNPVLNDAPQKSIHDSRYNRKAMEEAIRTNTSATTGSAKVNPKWASVAAGEDPSSAALNAETTSTLTWSTGDSDVYKELKVTLDADTLVSGEVVVMDLVFEAVFTELLLDGGNRGTKH